MILVIYLIIGIFIIRSLSSSKQGSHYPYVFLIVVTSGQTVTSTVTSLYPPPSADYPDNHYEALHGAAKAIDGDLLTRFLTSTIPSGLILTLSESMMIRRVRVFTGQV